MWIWEKEIVSTTEQQLLKRISFYHSFFNEETKEKKKQWNQDVVFCAIPLNFLVYLVSTFSSQVSKIWIVFLTFKEKFFFVFLCESKSLSIRDLSISSKCIFQGYIGI